MTSLTSDEVVPTAAAADAWTRALFQDSDDAIIIHDHDGQILEVNPAACRRLGYTRDELLRLKTRDIDAADFAAGFDERLQTQMLHGRFHCEGRHRAKDGRILPVDINTSAILWRERPAILAVMRDISHLKDTEDKLARQSGLLRSVLDHMGDAVLVADAERRLLAYNPAARRLFGLDRPEDAIGKPLIPQGMFQPDKVTPFAIETLPLARSLRGEEVDDVEVFYRRPGAPAGVFISFTARPLRDERGQIKGGVLVCRDISDRKRTSSRMAAQFAVARSLAETGDAEEALVRILQGLCESLGLDVGILWVLEGQERLLSCREAWKQPHLPLYEFLSRTRESPLENIKELPLLVLARSAPAACSLDSRDLPNLPARYALALTEGMRSAAAFPVQGGALTRGVVEFLSRSPDRFDEDLHPLMKSVGSQLGQVLERQRVEQALRDSEALYHSLVESLPQNIFRKDRAGRLTFANQRYCETLKRPLEDLLGKTDFDLFPPHLAAKYVQDDHRVMDTAEPIEAVEEHLLQTGDKIYVQVVKTPVYDAQDEVVGIQGIFWDVTERQRAAAVLADSERRYRQLTEATLDAIVLVDQQGIIKLFNPAAERLFGYEAREVIGQPSTLLAPEALRPAHQQGMARYLETRQPRIIGKTVEVKGLNKDGTEFPVEIALSVLPLGPPGPDGKAPVQFLGAFRDLTERNKMRSVLVQNEKLASIGMLSAGVAHEINNPLAFVANNLVVLERDGKGLLELLDLYESARPRLAAVDPDLDRRLSALITELDLDYTRENLARVLQRTREGVDRVTRIVHSLRGLARTDSPRSHHVHLPDLVESSLEILKGRYKRSGIVVEQDHDPNPRLTCVSTQISQVLLNLLVNAFQAVEGHRTAGGRITVRTRRQPDTMIIEIADNGPGIALENRQRLFDPFFTTKDVGEGTGLGLAITHNIVLAHSGHIEVDSLPGQGATFRVVLPLEKS